MSYRFNVKRHVGMHKMLPVWGISGKVNNLCKKTHLIKKF